MTYIIFYIFIFILSKLNKYKSVKSDIGFKFLFIVLVLFIGLRFEVGGDWFNYLAHFDNISNKSIELDFFQKELLYNSILLFSYYFFSGIWFINLILALIFCYGLYRFSTFSTFNRYNLLLSAFPVLIVVISLGFSRQSAAIGLFLLALIQLLNKNGTKFLLLIFVASMFHLSSIIFLPLVFLSIKKNKFMYFLIALIPIYILFSQLISPNMNYYNNSYLIRGYQSSGALIRILMNTIPALFLLRYKNYFFDSNDSSQVWRIFSYGSIIIFILYFFSPSSTVLDRISYYFIPIQLYFFSNIDRIPITINGNRLSGNFVFLYGLLVLIYWLLFSVHSEYWLPYDSYLYKIF
ncbi:EpsG family protein [Bacteroidia bacterium]|nr:EpsG family protein [Bacteroidia bacterium]